MRDSPSFDELERRIEALEKRLNALAVVGPLVPRPPDDLPLHGIISLAIIGLICASVVLLVMVIVR